MRRAVWKALRSDPKSVWGYGLAAFATPTTILLFLCLLLSIAFKTAANYWGALGIVILLPWAVAYPHPKAEKCGELATLPLPPESYFVRVTILVDDVVMGYDDAIASFVDGWLHVEGRRTSFSLGRPRRRPHYAIFSPTLHVGLDGGMLVSLRLVQEPDAPTVSLIDAKPFFESSKAWIESKPGLSKSGVLPPSAPQSEIAVRTVIRTLLLLGVLTIGITAISNNPRRYSYPMPTGEALALLCSVGTVVFWAIRALLITARQNRLASPIPVEHVETLSNDASREIPPLVEETSVQRQRA